MPGTGTSPVTTGRITRPSTIDGGGWDAPEAPCASSGAAATKAIVSARVSLRIELPEVFGAQVLEVSLELIGGELGRIRFRVRGLLGALADPGHVSAVDRKSTRLNSSHSQISYAVFC